MRVEGPSEISLAVINEADASPHPDSAVVAGTTGNKLVVPGGRRQVSFGEYISTEACGGSAG
jgi:hypothetical protein